MSKDDLPLISIIVPTYNRATLIIETINSILNQTYKNIELIVISDGSTDNTPKILSSIKDKRLQFIMLKKNHGRPAIPRNIGLKKSKGKYIAFCDDDDIWLPHKLDVQIKFLQNNPNILLTCSNAITFPSKNKRLCALKWKSTVLSYVYCINNRNPIVNSSVLFRRKVIEQVGHLDEDIVLKAVEDYDYWLRILRNKDYSIYFDVRILLRYRVFHNKIMLRADKEIKTVERLKKVLTKHLPVSYKRLSLLEKETNLTSPTYQNWLKLFIVKILTKYVQLISFYKK